MKPASEWTPGAEGMFLEMPHQTYLDAPGISASMLGHMMDSPAHYRAAQKQKQEATTAQSIGTYLHSSLLTPDAPLPGIAVKPDQRGFLNSNDGKAWKAAAEARGDIILSEVEHETLKASIEGLKADRMLCAVVANSWCEVSAWKMIRMEVTEFPYSADILLKCRFDIVPREYDALVDLKSSAMAGPDAWGRACAEHGYHRQAAHYLRLWNALNPQDQRNAWFWIVVEKPFGLPWWTPAHPAMIQQGERELDDCLRKLVACERSGEWPGRPQELTNLPTWYYRGARV